MNSILACFYAASIATAPIENGSELRNEIWKTAYSGNYPLAHKMILQYPLNNEDDIFFNTFMWVYLSYRKGDLEGIRSHLKTIDYLVENFVLNE